MREEMRGRGEKKEIKKGVNVCYASVLTLHKNLNIYYKQTNTYNKKWKKKKRKQKKDPCYF